ncbi:MAG: hypothetical protein JNL74_04490 [Fibrobacteres bacterium]|nr:hypothetical protein [Fibrobacterota bacterium]
MKSILILLAVMSCLLFSQSNVWTKLTNNQVGNRLLPLLTYQPEDNRFRVTLGAVTDYYIVQNFSLSEGRWINELPNDTLYGKWADSTGPARGTGLPSAFPYSSPFFNKVGGYMRPLTTSYTSHWGRVYHQGAYCPDDGKIYFYMTNLTFTYDTRTRLWDSLSVNGDALVTPPLDFQSMLRWGSLCYDPVNKEMVLFGGGSIDRDNGTPGTWTFNIATKRWTELKPAVQPPSRCFSPMVYDAKNRCIVLFGGDHLDYLTNDTWVYACSTRTWHKKNPAKSPAPRSTHAMVWLPKSQKVLLIGGNNYKTTLPLDMWTYDLVLNEWKLIKRFGTEPQPYHRYNNVGVNRIIGMAAADTGDRVVVLGDSGNLNNYTSAPCTFVLNCDAAAIDEAGTAAYGVKPDSILYYEHEPFYNPAWYTTSVAEPDTAANESTLKNLPVGTWIKMVSPKIYGGGQGRGWSTTIFAREKDVIVKWGGGHVDWCGTDIPHYSPSRNRWTAGYWPEHPNDFNGGINCTPGPVTFNRRPFMPGHTYHAYDWDPRLGKIVFLKWKYTYFYDIDRMDWDSARIINPVQNWPSANACITYTAHGTVLTGSDGRMWTLNSAGSAWLPLTVKGTAPTYFADNTGIIWDSKRDRLWVLQRGTGVTKVYSFSFSDSQWTQQTPSNTSVVTSTYDGYRELVYLPKSDRILTFMSATGGLLAYNCATNSWEVLPTSAGSSGLTSLENRSTTLMYDAKRNLIWNSNGFNLYVMRPDTGIYVTAEETAGSLSSQASVTVSPNPFNPSCALRVNVPANRQAALYVRLAVYDASGKLVRVVANGSYKPGVQNFAWDGIDVHGKKVSSGVYCFKLSAGGQNRIFKAIYAQ